MYTIGEVSEMFNLPVSTLRYYDKEGLLPDLQRVSGMRRFSDKTVETLQVIECLKKSGMEIKDIKEFMKWCSRGSETYPKRYEMFLRQREEAEKEIKKLEKVLDMIKYKLWYYEQAMADGNEERVRSLVPDKMPKEIKEAYERAHEKSE